MTRFLDGPAKGVSLTLGRSPLFLRVTRSAAGAFDALDQLDDAPKATETIWVYVLHGKPGWIHLTGHNKQGRRWGRTEALADYRLCVTQPDDATMRDTDKWRRWCAEESGRREAP